MLVFPQLGTGAAALYPVKKESRLRTVVNTMSGGNSVVYSDPDAARIGWELRAKGLTASEWGAIEALYQAVAGGWGTFTFLDPAGNLLANSEDFGAGAWTNGALIQLTSGIGDPLGTTRATRAINAGGAAESVAQALGIPGDFHYSLSVWAKTIGGSNVTLVASTAGGSASKQFALSGQWQRISMPVALGQNTVGVTFAATLDPGASVDLFGMQAEAQLAPSDYKKTGTRGGAFAKARFETDSLTVTAQSTDVFDAVVRIVSL